MVKVIEIFAAFLWDFRTVSLKRKTVIVSERSLHVYPRVHFQKENSIQEDKNVSVKRRIFQRNNPEFKCNLY